MAASRSARASRYCCRFARADRGAGVHQHGQRPRSRHGLIDKRRGFVELLALQGQEERQIVSRAKISGILAGVQCLAKELLGIGIVFLRQPHTGQQAQQR